MTGAAAELRLLLTHAKICQNMFTAVSAKQVAFHHAILHMIPQGLVFVFLGSFGLQHTGDICQRQQTPVVSS